LINTFEAEETQRRSTQLQQEERERAQRHSRSLAEASEATRLQQQEAERVAFEIEQSRRELLRQEEASEQQLGEMLSQTLMQVTHREQPPLCRSTTAAKNTILASIASQQNQSSHLEQSATASIQPDTKPQSSHQSANEASSTTTHQHTAADDDEEHIRLTSIKKAESEWKRAMQKDQQMQQASAREELIEQMDQEMDEQICHQLGESLQQVLDKGEPAVSGMQKSFEQTEDLVDAKPQEAAAAVADELHQQDPLGKVDAREGEEAAATAMRQAAAREQEALYRQRALHEEHQRCSADHQAHRYAKAKDHQICHQLGETLQQVLAAGEPAAFFSPAASPKTPNHELESASHKVLQRFKLPLTPASQKVLQRLQNVPSADNTENLVSPNPDANMDGKTAIAEAATRAVAEAAATHPEEQQQAVKANRFNAIGEAISESNTPVHTPSRNRLTASTQLKDNLVALPRADTSQCSEPNDLANPLPEMLKQQVCEPVGDTAQLANALFDALDTNHDGVLDCNEFSDAFEQLGASRSAGDGNGAPNRADCQEENAIPLGEPEGTCQSVLACVAALVKIAKLRDWHQDCYVRCAGVSLYLSR
jgi:hypothetical protein